MVFGEVKWRGKLPEVLNESVAWEEVLPILDQEKMYYGKLAVVKRLLIYFNDLPTKELAFKTVIDLVNQGYPYNVRPLFITGDISPTAENYDFANSYNLYKALFNRDQGMKKWSDDYFSKIDQKKFPKFIFYQALDAYSIGKLKEAISLLKDLLNVELDNPIFAKKVARTLARIYYEQENYEKSLDIYNNFLLKVNPITPSDWLEAAWNLYFLNRYPESLGYLYNLESKTVDPWINIEKYVIRGLIYREMCDTLSMEFLIQSFSVDFGDVIRKIKMGEPLQTLPILKTIFSQEGDKFFTLSKVIAGLKYEKSNLVNIPPKFKFIMEFLYDTELEHIQRVEKLYLDKALEQSALSLVMMSEKLKFLKFGVERQKYNPDNIFQESTDKKNTPLLEHVDSKSFIVRWKQMGDFWIDERMNYKGIIENQCNN